MRRKTLSLFIFFLFGILNAEPTYFFKQLSLQDGLSQSSVRTIHRDHHGLLWIGTKNGLNRFDGNQIKRYLPNNDLPLSLPGNQIWFIQQDSSQKLWIGTDNGLVFYNYENDNFNPIPINEPQAVAQAALTVGSCTYFVYSNRLIIHNSSNGHYDEVPFQNNQFIKSPYRLLHEKKDHLLIGSRWEGLYRCNTTNGKIEKLPFHPEDNLIDLCRDHQGNIWIASYGTGLYRYSPQYKLLNHYTANNSLLCGNAVSDIQCMNNGEVWIATDGAGISVFSNEENNFVRSYFHQSRNPYSLPVNSIHTLYQDDRSNVWIGTIRGGLLGFKRIFIRTFSNSFENTAFGLSERTVISFAEESNEKIWIGTDGNGINAFFPETGLFQHYPSTFQKKVVSLTNYSPDELLVSFYKEGIYIFDKLTGKLSPLPLPQRLQQSFSEGWTSINLKSTSDHQSLIFADSVYLYDRIDNSIRSIRTKENKKTDSGIRYGTQIGNNILLFGFTTIYRYNVTTQEIDPIASIKSQDGEITAFAAKSLSEFWIGTTNGLFSYDVANKIFLPIKTSLFEYVSILHFDSNGFLWVGTPGTLYRYYPRNNYFSAYGESDGVSPNEFLSKSFLLASDKKLYLGGVNGFVVIDPEIPHTKRSSETIEIQDIILNGRRLKGAFDSYPNKIEIPTQYQSLHVNLLVNNNDLFKKCLYRYRLMGFKPDYEYSQTSKLQFYNLLPGTYRLLAQYDLDNGEWSTEQEIITIEVLPPWWQSTWFICLSILIIGAVVLFLILRYRNKQRARLQKTLERKEKELYEQKLRFLININHELRTPLTLISAPIERLLKQARPWNEIMPILTSISHQTKRMRSVIDMILDMRKLEYEKERIYCSPVAINDWIESIIQEMRPEFEAKQIALHFTPCHTLDKAFIDESKTEKVILNLLSNALKFTEADAHKTVTTTLQQNGDQFRFSVADQGIGLQTVNPSKLFTRFYQGEHRETGSGIGLSYSKMLIEIQGGTIGAIANPDQGATFFFELPISIEHEHEATKLYTIPQDADLSGQIPIDLSGRSLLIVEDEEELNEFLRLSMGEIFATVLTASNGCEAMEIIKQKQPDIIVSDIMMPCMDGFELCRQLKSTLEISHIPIVLFTALNTHESTSLGYKLGADAYITKPFDIESLLDVLKNIFRIREHAREKIDQTTILKLAEEISFSREDEIFLRKLILFIENEMHNESLDVDALAKQMLVSRSLLYTKVKKLTQMGVKDLINSIRIKKAQRLLRESDMPIVMISEKLGFSQQRYFSMVFRAKMGISPSEYRKGKNNNSSPVQTESNLPKFDD